MLLAPGAELSRACVSSAAGGGGGEGRGGGGDVGGQQGADGAV